MNSKDITVFIRTKNEERWLADCLKNVFQQKTEFNYEVIIYDSGSKDKTLEIANNYPVKIVNIDENDFGYGSSLNQGAHLVKGKVLVSLSAHVIPLNSKWLNYLTQPLLNDNSVIATYGRQLYKAYLHPVEYWLYKDTFSLNNRTFTEWSPLCKLSNANAAYRTHVLRKFPFKNLEYGEDADWARRVISKQRQIAYVYRASAIHYHDYTLRRKWHVSVLTGKAYKQSSDSYAAVSDKKLVSILLNELLFGLIQRDRWTKLSHFKFSLPEIIYWYFYWWLYMLIKQIGIYVGYK